MPESIADLGKLYDAVLTEAKDIVAVSALLTTTLTRMKSVMEAARQAGSHGRRKVIGGGAPLTQQYADSIGADGYSNNASGAVALARQLVAT